MVAVEAEPDRSWPERDRSPATGSAGEGRPAGLPASRPPWATAPFPQIAVGPAAGPGLTNGASPNGASPNGASPNGHRPASRGAPEAGTPATAIDPPGAPQAKKSRAGILGNIGRRLSWGIADQAVSSLTNSAISIYAAKTLGAADFGAFSLAYVTYSFALNASRGLGSDPLMVRFSGAELPVWRRAVSRCSGTAAAVGIVSALVVLAVAAALSGVARVSFIALGLTLPGLLLQDSWRYAFFAIGRGSRAFVNDLVWAGTLIPALLFLHRSGHEDVFWLVLAWGASGTVAALVGPLQARTIPRIFKAREWVSTHRDLGPRYLAENTANSGAAQLRAYGIGIIISLTAVGYIQASSTLMGPFMVIFMGLSLVTVPEAARVLREAPRHLSKFCFLMGSGLALIGILWGVALIVALPRGLGAWLLGPIWKPAYPLVLPVAIGLAGACMTAGASAGLRALGQSRRSLRVQVIASVMYVVAGLAGGVTDGAYGSVVGTSIAIWAGSLMWWWQLRRALKEPAQVPGGAAPGGAAPVPGRAAGRHRTTVTAPARPRPRPRR